MAAQGRSVEQLDARGITDSLHARSLLQPQPPRIAQQTPRPRQGACERPRQKWEVYARLIWQTASRWSSSTPTWSRGCRTDHDNAPAAARCRPSSPRPSPAVPEARTRPAPAHAEHAPEQSPPVPTGQVAPAGRPPALQADRSIVGGQLPALGQPHPAPARWSRSRGPSRPWPRRHGRRHPRGGARGPVLRIAGWGSFSEDLFFSFTTLPTTGHGNLVRAATPARAWPSGRCLSGSCLVTAVAKVVGTWRPSPGRGHLPTDNDRAGVAPGLSPGAGVSLPTSRRPPRRPRSPAA
jgi:hypothetical protein